MNPEITKKFHSFLIELHDELKSDKEKKASPSSLARKHKVNTFTIQLLSTGYMDIIDKNTLQAVGDVVLELIYNRIP